MKRTAAILMALLTMAGPALALTVSDKVGPLVKEAQTLINTGNYNSATAKLNEADAVKSGPDDATVINQLRQYLAVKSGASPPSQP